MKERFAEIGQKLAKNIDRVAVVTFLILLLAAGFLYFQEVNYSPPPPPDRQRNEWDVKIPASNETAAPAPTEGEEGGEVEEEPELSPYQKVHLNFPENPPPISEDEQLRRLVTINMFDAGSVRSQIEQAKIIEQDLARARDAFGAENYDEAMRIVETILRRNPDHKRTQELKGEIQEAMTSGATDSDTSTEGQSGG